MACFCILFYLWFLVRSFDWAIVERTACSSSSNNKGCSKLDAYRKVTIYSYRQQFKMKQSYNYVCFLFFFSFSLEFLKLLFEVAIKKEIFLREREKKARFIFQVHLFDFILMLFSLLLLLFKLKVLKAFSFFFVRSADERCCCNCTQRLHID